MSTPSTMRLDVKPQPGGLPLLLAETNGDIPTWVTVNRDSLRAAATEHGAVVVRGLGLNDRAYVAALFQYLATDLVAEREAFAPRPIHPEGVYASTKWPSHQQMCMHHELSYTLEFPGLMFFACLTAPVNGGATAVADSRAVLRALPTELVERFARFHAGDLVLGPPDGPPLEAWIESIEGRRRVPRDPISGEPLPAGEDDGVPVVSATLIYPFAQKPPA